MVRGGQLSGDLLDLRCLFCEHHLESFYFVLLCCHGGFQFSDGDLLFLVRAHLFLDFAMLFEKLIKQHRIQGFIANGVSLPSSSKATRSRLTFATSSATSPNCGMPSGSSSF